ncbi:MAG: hypothetical protein AVDCRST_MAG24-1657 [uncultured Nocardioidaceae bacterium]|uniref:DUF559 domain-containing protein n=1 Tax=uncultured Nocardioidaceae bacterium TaxID=253824 RepID=A0A6J4M2T0_9ACTN|nr:MAG: hypothetical protein AVDCRST_MAG24-1657 [uncultured Nocardioidaceae bacterium]
MAEQPVDVLARVLPRAPFTGGGLASVGLSRPDLRRLLRAGLVRRVLLNAYVRSDVPDSVELRARCLALVCGPHAVVVDRTAAWLWGIDLREVWNDPAPPVLDVFVRRGRKRVLRPEALGGERDLADQDVCQVAGTWVTTPVRTCIDLACRLSRYEAIVALDAFMREHGLTHQQLQVELVRHRGRRGVVQARVLVPLADPRSESSGESITRLATYDAGLPPPVPQYWVLDEGRPLYRLDLAYPREKVCIEYDGERYHSSEVQRRHDAVRRDWLRRHGWTVVVVTKDSFRGAALDGWLSQVRRTLYAAA